MIPIKIIAVKVPFNIRRSLASTGAELWGANSDAWAMLDTADSRELLSVVRIPTYTLWLPCVSLSSGCSGPFMKSFGENVNISLVPAC